MEQAVDFWLKSYQMKWFVHRAIVDKTRAKTVGIVEMFNRTAKDAFNGAGVLRLDLKSEYEKEVIVKEIPERIALVCYDLFACEGTITKVLPYAVERMAAVTAVGFVKSDHLLVGTHDGYAHKDYRIIHK